MTVTIRHGDCREVLRTMPDESVHCCVTSPPYFGLRDYGVAGQIGLEPTPEAFVAEMVAVFREVRRVLRDDGTLWLNLGDSYAGSGRGGNPTEATSGLQGGQASQRASMIVRSRPVGSQLPAGFHEQARQAGNVGRAWVPPPAGLKQKDLMGIPWMVAFALRADGWYLRQDIIWSKPNPMPESVTDRCTKAHEYIFLLSKSERYSLRRRRGR
jgi:DNA modification methylase